MGDSERPWREGTVRDGVQQVVGGGTPPRSVPSFWGGPIPWASVKDFSDDSVDLEGTAECISAAGLAASTASLVEPGIPIVCTRMAVGRCAAPKHRVAINQDLKALEPGPGVHSRFLLHGLKRLQPRLDAAAIGSTVRGIRLGDLLDAPFGWPPGAEQVRIAEMLDTLDDAIRSTERLIAKLEDINRGFLNDLLTRGIGDNGEVRDPERHPEQFTNSPLGRLPRAWKMTTLGSVASVERGKFTHRPRNDPRFYGGDSPFIQTGDVTGARGGLLRTYSQTLNEKGVGVSKQFPQGAIAVTIAANIADTCILASPMYFPDSVVGVVVEQAETRFVEMCIRRAKPRLEARAPQSAQRNINLQDLRPLTIPLPTGEEQKAIAERYEAVERKAAKELQGLAKLRLLKKGLSDDLLTGRVRVVVTKEATP